MNYPHDKATLGPRVPYEISALQFLPDRTLPGAKASDWGDDYAFSHSLFSRS